MYLSYVIREKTYVGPQPPSFIGQAVSIRESRLFKDTGQRKVVAAVGW